MARRIGSNSIAFRLLAVTALWTVLALLVTGILLTTLFKQNAERDFQRVLLAHTFNVMGAIDVDDDGNLTGTPNLGDPRFLQPSSGWYWSVSKAEKPQTPLLHSASISGEDLVVPAVDTLPFNELFRRVYPVQEGEAMIVQRLEAQLFVGEDNTLYQVLVAIDRTELNSTVSNFQTSLWIAFCLFGVGSVTATYFVIRFGLRPLERAQRALGRVREGRAEQIDGSFPVEVAPLVGEINALVRANRSVMERARTQVGNLAHALKTPLAVLLNEARKPDKDLGNRVEQQANQMQSQIEAYLNRARIAAQRGTLTARSQAKPVVERLVRVMRKLSPHIEFELSMPKNDVVFQGEEQDLEEVLGNLLENASRFAKSRIDVAVKKKSSSDGRLSFQVVIEDDGAGLSPDQQKLALRRGKRLDETKPGSGLGLSIVKDICDEYEGSLSLGRASAGGLKAIVELPRVRSVERNEREN